MSDNSNTVDENYALKQLRGALAQSWHYARDKATLWTKIYYIDRCSLLLFSALTSAQAVAALDFMKSYQPLFAFLVTLITGFDVFLKPGQKMAGYYVASEEYNEALRSLDEPLKDRARSLSNARVDYSRINKALRSLLQH